MESNPLVTVICLCYNHDAFVQEAIYSVLTQTYSNVELIVVDDASTDRSVARIRELIADYPSVTFLSLDENVGNCKAFNLGLARAKGKYIIDLAADDILCPNRIEVGVKDFEEVNNSYGVHFSNAFLIDNKGHLIRSFYPLDEGGKLKIAVPQGDVYAALVQRFFICTPTMMMRKDLLEELGGYDENLAYE
ncbi:glycosyltransferase family 2 protein, partial [Xanthovirga aplysinae]|uniref:glycosyltransferase family 2 protein n=1 Tax=Xanthovirga aplysinae TaxID=2529853 RepID=UPI0012BD454E